jgi:hypothetical protein
MRRTSGEDLLPVALLNAGLLSPLMAVGGGRCLEIRYKCLDGSFLLSKLITPLFAPPSLFFQKQPHPLNFQ